MNQKKRIPAWAQNSPKHINPAQRWWVKLTNNRQAILVMRYLAGEAMSRKAEWPDDDPTWAIVESTNREIYDSLRTNSKTKAAVTWKSYPVANTSIYRALKELERVGLIKVVNLGGRARVIAVYGACQSEQHLLNICATLEQHLLNISATFVKHLLNISTDSTAKNKAKKGRNVTECNVIEVTVKNEAKEKAVLSPQIEIQDEDNGLTGYIDYCLVTKDKKMLQSIEMNRSEEPRPWPEEYITGLEEYITRLSEQWGFQGGLDNNKLSLEGWINSSAHKALVAPWLHEGIPYTDLRDVSVSQKIKTFEEYDWEPLSVEAMNRILAPRFEAGRKAAESIYGFYAQPFNNPYLSPEKKGLAFIRQFPFGYHIRDTFIHPWSPPVLPMAVVADDKGLLAAWNKRFWHSGSHPFVKDTTTEKIKEAISVGNREVPDDPFFDVERYKSIESVPQHLAGARSSILTNPGPFQLLYWYCGTIGVSPTVMLEAFKRAHAYNGHFNGMNLLHESNKNADKIRIFALYLKHFAWGDSKGSWLPREQGVQQSLSSGVGQEWSHQGVLGGTTVLVRCHDGVMREFWLTNYQKAVYDLKFNPQSDKDGEILDKLIKELL